VGRWSQPADSGCHMEHRTSERELYVNYNNLLFYFLKRGGDDGGGLRISPDGVVASWMVICC